MVLLTLRFLVPHVAGLTALWIVRVPSLSKILLRRDSKYEFLLALTTNQNPRLKPTLHRVPPLRSTTLHVAEQR
jgi:hypothetical protein